MGATYSQGRRAQGDRALALAPRADPGPGACRAGRPYARPLHEQASSRGPVIIAVAASFFFASVLVRRT